MDTSDKTVAHLKAMCKEQNIKGYTKLNRVELVYLLDSKSTAPPRSAVEIVKQTKRDYYRIQKILEKVGIPNRLETNICRQLRARRLIHVYKLLTETRFSYGYRFTPVQGQRIGTGLCLYSATAHQCVSFTAQMGDDDNVEFNALRKTLAEYQTRCKDYGMTILLSLNRHLPHDMVRLIAQDFI